MENEATTPGKWQVILRYGLFLGLAYIGISLVVYILGMHNDRNTGMNLVMLAATFIIIYLGIKARRDEIPGGFITYGKGLGVGILIALIAGLLSSAYSVLFMKYIDPDMLNKMMETARQDVIERGGGEEQIEKALYIMEKMQSPGIIFISGVVITLIYGLIASLIVSIFTRKENPDEAYNSLDA